jgi:hypothetical protein
MQASGESYSRTTIPPVILISAYTKILQSLGFYGCDAFIPNLSLSILTENRVIENKWANPADLNTLIIFTTR